MQDTSLCTSDVNFTVQTRNEYKAFSSADFKNLENPRVENRNIKLTIIYPRKHPAQFAGYDVQTRIIIILIYHYYTVNTPLKIGKTQTICTVFLYELLLFAHPRAFHCFVLIHMLRMCSSNLALVQQSSVLRTL